MMMKKNILLFCFVAQSLFVRAQASDSIPNAGFETWIFVSWFANPISWITNNNQLLANTVVPDTDSYSGSFAMELINMGSFIPLAYCGFRIIHHLNALTG